jgi:acetoin utilization protein AcuB
MKMNPNISISAIMTTDTISVKTTDTLPAIEKIFKQFRIHHLPVVDKANSVVGIISKTDVLTFLKKLSLNSSGKAYSQFIASNSTAEEIMTPEPIVVDPDDSIGLAADIFLVNTLHALPVVEDNRLVGIITTHDLLKYAFAEAV